MADAHRLQAHPWHGIPIGDDAPHVVNVFVEIVPTDGVKYEIDKASGHLKLDRPQQFSNVCPAPYGFLPGTWCHDRVAALATRRPGLVGDGDPLDVCVLTERPIGHGAVLLRARPIGGIRLVDRGEADDKIVAVLVDDPAYGALGTLADAPPPLVDRLRHYFLTYKDLPGTPGPPRCEIDEVYEVDGAHAVIRAAVADYVRGFPTTA